MICSATVIRNLAMANILGDKNAPHSEPRQRYNVYVCVVFVVCSSKLHGPLVGTPFG